jgi:hypothetical protein
MIAEKLTISCRGRSANLIAEKLSGPLVVSKEVERPLGRDNQLPLAGLPMSFSFNTCQNQTLSVPHVTMDCGNIPACSLVVGSSQQHLMQGQGTV